MAPSLRPGTSRLRGFAQLAPWLLLISGLIVVRLSKGAGFTDAYALLSRPFWPGPAQREWVSSAASLEDQARLSLLEQDNQRLRDLLQPQRTGGADSTVPAAVISRQPRGWWQQLELGKGGLHGIAANDAVIGPG